MSIESPDLEYNIRHLNIQSKLAEIAKNNLVNFHESERKSEEFDHLFKEYFEHVFLSDVADFLVPLIKSSKSTDVDVFFIKCSFYMKNSPAYKSGVTINLYNDIIEDVKYYLYEMNVYNQSEGFISALSNLLFDFNFMDILDLSTFFEDLLDRYVNGNLDENKISSSSNFKLKTNLSVPELVLLFRSLDELKPDIFAIESKEELFAFIAANFETKASSNLSVQSVKNNFYKYHDKSKEKWKEHFSTLRVFVSNLKEN
jgi:hypothetical protein